MCHRFSSKHGVEYMGDADTTLPNEVDGWRDLTITRLEDLLLSLEFEFSGGSLVSHLGADTMNGGNPMDVIVIWLSN